MRHTVLDGAPIPYSKAKEGKILPIVQLAYTQWYIKSMPSTYDYNFGCRNRFL